jgi:hypothetical protein
MKEAFNNLPQWSKGIIAVSAIVAVGLVGFVIYKKINTIKDKKESDETADSAEDEYLKLKKEGQTLSYPQTKYFSAATAIKNALDGCETYVGEEDAVYAVLNVVKKPIDWYYLVNVFGSRKVDDCGIGGETMYALPELLYEQLGNLSPSSFYTKSNIVYLKNELKKRGVEI